MSPKRIVFLTVLILVALVLVGAIVTVLLVQARPDWYQPVTLTHQELLEADEQMMRDAAEFHSAAQIAESFVLPLTSKQINDRLAVLEDRRHILPDDIADPVVFIGDGAVYVGARLTYKGTQAIVSTRLTAYVDPDGLLHLTVDKPQAGTLALPETFLADSLDRLQRNLSAKIAASTSDSDEARAARRNKDLLAKIFAALDGIPVELRFRTREDLQITVDAVSIKPDLLEIKFRPLVSELSPE